MKPAHQDDKLELQRLTDDGKALLGKNLKAIVLFGSRASGTAGKYSDFDVLVIAEDLPEDWRKRDALILELDRHGIFDLLLYTEVELKNAIHCVNPLIMSIFDRPHKVLYTSNR